MMLYLRFHLFNRMSEFQYLVYSQGGVQETDEGCRCCVFICRLQTRGYAKEVTRDISGGI